MVLSTPLFCQVEQKRKLHVLGKESFVSVLEIKVYLPVVELIQEAQKGEKLK